MKKMAEAYGFDISEPAKNAKEAVQWLYFGYLAAIKTQNGAAMSVGRVSTFLDIYLERDLEAGIITEAEAQELIDHLVMKCRMVKFARIPSYNQLFSGNAAVYNTVKFGSGEGPMFSNVCKKRKSFLVMKCRMVKFARIPSYNQLFSGDPVWATLEVAGLGTDGRSMVTKNDLAFHRREIKIACYQKEHEADREKRIQIKRNRVKEQTEAIHPAVFRKRRTDRCRPA